MSEKSLQDREQETIALLSEITRDWNTGLSGGITPQTALVSDLGFESLDVVHMVTAIEQRFGRRDLPFEDLLMTEGRYVDDLTVDDIARFLHRHLGGGA
jgi:acyl carrier protein